MQRFKQANRNIDKGRDKKNEEITSSIEIIHLMFFLKKMPGNIAQIVFVVATFSYKSLKVTHNSLK